MGLYLYGASGHGKVIAEIAENHGLKLNGFIDGDLSKTSLWKYEVIHKVPVEPINVIVSIGSNIIRKKIVSTYNNFRYQLLIHPNTSISKQATIGEGTVVMAGVSVDSDTKIGKHCIINSNASVDHDCLVDGYGHISPNAAL